MAALGELSGFIVEHIRSKRDRPGEDLVSLLVDSEVGGCPLSKEELFMFLLTLLVAGNETTRTLLSGPRSSCASTRTSAPSSSSDTSLVPAGVEECLRWVTPVHAFCRTATEDAVVADTRIREGDYLCMLYASGNRDERIFGDDASEFDVRRPANPMHLAFGFGEHVCLGASLARLEARIFVEELLGRFPVYEVTGPAERVRSTTVAGIRSLPVVLARRVEVPRFPAARPDVARRAVPRQRRHQQRSRSFPPSRWERTNPFSRNTFTCMLTVGWARRKSLPARPPSSARWPASAGVRDGWDRPPP